ncbi:sorting nexin-25-like isoform X1 [Trichogramma pretiosum]|uniref:sorting nexin-25-like isoform X1 n=1 Tax=Trichogramma pretiosum TaxID=7493 RepID=UPI0006C9BB19|nr:sorting nexin-25-like isoform X1 [Trichogramma pretiosum]XP_023318856.1 sorting nexin-25-like isoform X1 [Trichogramma pretiosum]XP_023318857.1 sorting nexin-25-like isoform X1 [Trichogramma pretiosum]
MLQPSVVILIAIFLIVVLNYYYGLIFYIFMGLLTICATSCGPAIIFYAYTRFPKLEYKPGWKYYLLSIFALLIAVLFYYGLIVHAFFGVLAICGMTLGPTMVLYMHSNLSSTPTSNKCAKKTVNKLNAFEILLIKSAWFNDDVERDPNRYPLVYSRLVDGGLQNLMDLVFRDFVGCWLKDIVSGADDIMASMKQDFWEAIQKIHSRSEQIDHTNLVAFSMVNTVTFHFEKIRHAQEAVIDGESPTYLLSPHLITKEGEIEYLRKVSEVFILFFMPRGYTFSPAKSLVREIFTCRVLLPFINTITDPDYINQKILSYIEQQQMTEELHKKTCDYADSYEDFLAMIKATRDVDVLKRIRFNIVTEIMEATTTQNIQRAQGLDPENGNVGKSEAAQAKKLKKYIGQLTHAKNVCESRMRAMGWDGFPMEDDDVIDAAAIAENRVIPLRTILDSVIGRKYFSQFLEQVSSRGLIGYWTAVQELRAVDKSSWHQLGAEIFYTYIAIPTAEIKVDKETMKRMESFLMGDKGPDVFYEVQEMVVNILEEKYYPSFIVSEQYKHLQKSFNEDKTDVSMNDQKSLMNGTICDNTSLLVGEHSTYARNKLAQLQEKLTNKMQALSALKTALKPENKVLGILAKEVEWLLGEKRQLEAHLNHTEMWAEHLGHWRADVQSAECTENGEAPEFVLVVHMVADEADETSISTGWVVLRKLPEFQELHRKLRQLCSSVKTLELPSQPLKFFGKMDKATLEKSKAQIQKYLNVVLENDRLNQSEALYAFLSPSSERLKQGTPSPKKSRFSLATLFKSSSSGSSGDSREKDDDDDYPSLIDDNEPSRSVTDSFLGPGKDSIAEPLYALLGEIFDLRGVFRWLRRSLITFVQLTYGRTINRQIRDSVTWIFSEPMLYYYIQLLTKSWWPNGELAWEFPERTEADKEKTREEARQQFLNNVPYFLTNLVGAQTAQRGSTKVFDAFQNVQLNKQLFYDLFEVVMYEMFPELKKDRD